MSESDSHPDAQGQTSPSATRTGPRPGTAVQEGGHTMSTLLSELTEAVASNLPASQQNPKNRKHIVAMEKVMRAYFKRLETAFPSRKVGVLYNRHVGD